MLTARDLVQRCHETWNRRDVEGFRDLAAVDLETKAPGGVAGTGPEGMEQLYQSWNDAFPENVVEIISIVGDDAIAAVEGRFSGTHTGVMRGASGDLPPTGRRLELEYTLVVKATDGRLTSHHLYFDQMEIRSQLGLTATGSSV